MNNFTKIRVTIDWWNWGAFDRAPLDGALNNIPDSIWYLTHSTYFPNNNCSLLHYGYNEMPVAAAVRWKWVNTATTDEIWFFRNAGNTSLTLPTSPSRTETMTIWFRQLPYFADMSNLSFDIMGWNGTSWVQLSTVNGNARVTASDPTSFKITQTYTTLSNTTKLAVRIRKTAAGGGIFDLYVDGFYLTLSGQTHGNEWRPDESLFKIPVSGVTQYLKQVTWKLGKSSWDEAMPAEGTATLVLDNPPVPSQEQFGGMFSPENKYVWGADGTPLVNRRVLIERYIGTTGSVDQYELMWAGWTKSIKPSAGIYRDREVVIECEQGISFLEKTTYQPVIEQNVSVATAMQRAVTKGYELPTNPAFARVGLSRVNFTWVVNPLVFFGAVGSGDTLPVIGVQEPDNESAWNMLAELADLSNNWLWMNRFGSLSFVAPSSLPASSTDLYYGETLRADYQYGQEELITALLVDADEYTFTPTAPVNRFPLSDAVTFDVPANTTIVATVPNTYFDQVSGNGRSYGTHGDQIAVGVRSDDTSIPAAFTIGWVGGSFDSRSSTWSYEITYTIKNANAFPIKVTVTTLGYGWRHDAHYEGLKIALDTNALLYGYREKVVSNHYLQTKALINAYVTRKLNRYSIPYGWFPVISVALTDQAISDKVRNLQIGKIFRFYDELQTGATKLVNGSNTYKEMMIIGEAGRWTPNYLEYTIYTSPKITG